MFEHLVALESALDAVLPRPRLRGQLPDTLVATARQWSEAVWKEAERLGPFPISGAEIAHGIQIGRAPLVSQNASGAMLGECERAGQSDTHRAAGYQHSLFSEIAYHDLRRLCCGAFFFDDCPMQQVHHAVDVG